LRFVSHLFEQAPEFGKKYRQKYAKTQAKEGMITLPSLFYGGQKDLV
jgi:hypothetical protein